VAIGAEHALVGEPSDHLVVGVADHGHSSVVGGAERDHGVLERVVGMKPRCAAREDRD
jgi:hypothetical protein